MFITRPLAISIILLVSVHLHADESISNNWHQWRGPEANGVSRTATPPIEWSEEQNIGWKVSIDGSGNATPIVWGNKVFLLTAINTERVNPSLPKPEDQPKRGFGIKFPNTSYQFVVLCLDRRSGKELWRRTATELVPHEGHHGDADFASTSPMTDGERRRHLGHSHVGRSAVQESGDHFPEDNPPSRCRSMAQAVPESQGKLSDGIGAELSDLRSLFLVGEHAQRGPQALPDRN